MSAEDQSQLNSQDRESLVAYLDGELDKQGTAQMEQTLAIDTEAQHEAEMLKKTWQLLDELPRPTLSHNFTTRTLASIQLKEIEASRKIRPLQMLKFFAIVLLWCVCFATSASVGYMLTSRWEKPSHYELIQDLDLIQNMDTYPYIRDKEFVRKLEESGKFNEQVVQPQSP